MIEVGHLRATYCVPADHPAPHNVRSRLDEVAVRILPQAIASLLARALPEEDQGIWLIRRLEVDLGIDLAFDDERLAAQWAVSIARALTSKIESGDADALHFESRAAYLARFLVDAASGAANGKWYYRAFEGLSHLASSAAVRTAVCDVPQIGLEALLLIPKRQLAGVLGALTDPDAQRVLAAITLGDGAAGDLRLLLETWQSGAGSLHAEAAESRAALLFYLSAVRHRRDIAGPRTRAVVQALVRLARLAQAQAPRATASLVDAIASGQLSELYLEAGASAEVLAPLAGSPRELLLAFASPNPAPKAERCYTTYGGVFLLLPLLNELPVELSGADPLLLRFWILLKCLGQPRAYSLFFDPLVRELLRIDPALSPETFVRWQRSVSLAGLRRFRRTLEDERYRRDSGATRNPADFTYLRLPKILRFSLGRDTEVSEAARLVLRNLAWRLPGFAGSSFPYLFANFLDFPASVEDQPNRRVIRAGAPPLAVVLNLAGLRRNAYVCSWLDLRPFELFPED